MVRTIDRGSCVFFAVPQGIVTPSPDLCFYSIRNWQSMIYRGLLWTPTARPTAGIARTMFQSLGRTSQSHVCSCHSLDVHPSYSYIFTAFQVPFPIQNWSPQKHGSHVCCVVKKIAGGRSSMVVWPRPAWTRSELGPWKIRRAESREIASEVTTKMATRSCIQAMCLIWLSLGRLPGKYLFFFWPGTNIQLFEVRMKGTVFRHVWLAGIGCLSRIWCVCVCVKQSTLLLVIPTWQALSAKNANTCISGHLF